MGLFGKLLKTTFDVAALPVDIVRDVATMGGMLTDENKPYVAQKLELLGNDLQDIRNELDDL